MKSAKGGAYEREICKLLSKWWTDGVRDDVFWRSASSGGRATRRTAKGKDTYGQYGDIQAVDPIGLPLTQLCTIEVKRGYSDCSVADLFDSPLSRKQTKWEGFVIQAFTSHKGQETPYWVLIHRRDKQQAMIYIPRRLARALDLQLYELCPYAVMRLGVKEDGGLRTPMTIVALQLEHFCQSISPKTIIRLYHTHVALSQSS